MEKRLVKASLAVLVLDDFTGRRLRGAGVRVCVQGARGPIYKPEGYYVFTNLTMEEQVVCVEAWGYTRESCQVRLSRLDPLCPVIKVRLKPDRTYRLPEGTTVVEGSTWPESQIRLFLSRPEEGQRVLYDCQKGDRIIRIYNPEKQDQAGRIFFLTDRQGQVREEICIQNALESEEDAYELKSPLENGYQKAQARLIPVHQVMSDQTGSFFLAFECWNGNGEEAVSMEIGITGSHSPWTGKIRIIPGVRNSVGTLP